MGCHKNRHTSIIQSLVVWGTQLARNYFSVEEMYQSARATFQFQPWIAFPLSGRQISNSSRGLQGQLLDSCPVYLAVLIFSYLEQWTHPVSGPLLSSVSGTLDSYLVIWLCSFLCSSQPQSQFFKKILPGHSVWSGPSPVTWLYSHHSLSSTSFIAFAVFKFTMHSHVCKCLLPQAHKFPEAQTMSVSRHCTSSPGTT